MIKFLFKGLIRDQSRSRLPLLVVSIGVMLTIFLHAYITGFMGDTIEINARFSQGHVKVVTSAYSEESNQGNNELAITQSDSLMNLLGLSFSEMEWAQRILFGGLIDAPDDSGETKAQGPAFGLAMDLLHPDSKEAARLNLDKSLVRGHLPTARGEVLLSENFCRNLGTDVGSNITLIGSTMDGSMAVYNFKVAGTISFGIELMDRGAVIADIEDVRIALQMPDASSEIIGFLKNGYYHDDKAVSVAERFNAMFASGRDEFSPLMIPMSRQGAVGQYVLLAKNWSWYISVVFILAMSLVLWNAGLLGGLRRYGEVGVRLAIGEAKRHVYVSMILESVMIGFAGTIVGTAFGLFFAYLVQKYGIDISGMMKGSAVMMPSSIRARITPPDFYIGFIPGLISTVLGTMLSGIGILKRQTARLFKELEA